MTNFVKKLTFHRSANKFSPWVLSAKKKKGDDNRISFSFGLYPPPGTCRKTYCYCNAKYCPAVLLGAAPIVAHCARVAGAAKIVVDELKRTTASGLEQ